MAVDVKGTGFDAQVARLIQDEKSQTHAVVAELLKGSTSSKTSSK